MYLFTVFVSYIVDNDSEDSHHVKLSLHSVIQPVAKEHIDSYHQTILWITEHSALSITR